MTHCLRYESASCQAMWSDSRLDGTGAQAAVGSYSPSIVGSYSSTKWLWISWMVRHDFPTPPPPTTTSLYSLRNWRDVLAWGAGRGERAGDAHLGGHCV